MNVEGSFDDEGGSRTLVENLAREMKERKQLGVHHRPLVAFYCPTRTTC